jgi:hypothetical protein
VPQFRTTVGVGLALLIGAVPPGVRNDVGCAVMPGAPSLRRAAMSLVNGAYTNES